MILKAQITSPASLYLRMTMTKENLLTFMYAANQGQKTKKAAFTCTVL